MKAILRLFNRLRSSFAHKQMDQDLDAEMTAHLEMAIEENVKQGMSTDEARRQALIRFGGVEQAKQQHREARGFQIFDILWLDLRYTFRTMRREPGFSLVAVLILALGIGANIAVFSVVNTILLRPLPFHDPQQLVWITTAQGKGGLSDQTYSTDAYRTFEAQNRSFQGVTGYFAFSSSDNLRLTGRGEPRPLTGTYVVGNFFQTVGVKPLLGRLFTGEECKQHGPPAILMSYGFWKRQFNADPNIVGRAINLSGQSVTVIGVLPESFDFGSVFSPGSKVDVYGPAILDDMADWGNTLTIIGRLKPGVSLAQAQAEADLIFPKLLFSFKHPEWGGNYTGKLTILKDHVRWQSAALADHALVLVVSELALACVLLVGAGLLLHSFLRVLDVDLGFEPSRTAAIKVDFEDGDKGTRRGVVLQEMLQRISALPGIEAAGISDNLPLDMNRAWGLSAKGKQYRKGELPGTFVYVATPGYLHVMGMRLLEGRDLSWQDGPDNERVVIINQTAARYLWPGQDPVGQIALVSGRDARVIGLVADVRESSAEAAPGWQMYLPITQAGPVGAELVVRTKLPPEVLASTVMSTLRSLNPGQPAAEFRPIQQIVDHSVSPRRFFVLLVGVFAVLGLVLASLGIYGVISYSVTRQTQEIGIRMALGATSVRVQLGLISKTLRLALIGILLGAIASCAMARAITSLLFAITPNDPPTFTSTILLLTAVAIVAGYVPARRASRIDPMRALRTN